MFGETCEPWSWQGADLSLKPWIWAYMFESEHQGLNLSLHAWIWASKLDSEPPDWILEEAFLQASIHLSIYLSIYVLFTYIFCMYPSMDK